MDEERKKRLEDLKQQSLELEKEAQEREKRNEERKKAREEQQRLAAEQEKKDEEERIKKQKEREERRKKREEDEKILKEEMEKLETDKANRVTSPKTPPISGSIALSPSTSSYSISENSGGGDSSTSLLSPQAISAKEEREKRRKELEEETKRLELEQQRIREEREKRKEERRLQQEEEQRKLQELLDKKESEKIEKSKQEKDNQQEKELADKLEKERLDKELADKLENEKLENERIEKERLAAEKEQKEKEQNEKEEKEREEKEKKEREEKELADKLEKEQKEKEQKEKEEKELADKLEKERKEKEEKERQQEKELADKLEKETKEKEEKERLDKEKKEKEERELTDKLEKERKEKEEKERLENELADKLAKEKKEKEEKEEKEKQEKEKEQKEKEEKELADKLVKEQKEKEEKELADKLAKEQKEKEEKERQEKELADKLVKEQKEKEEKELADKLVKEQKEKEEKELADKLAKEQKEKEEKELADKLEKDRLEKEKIEKEEKEKQEKELTEKLEREQKEKELAEKLEKEKKEKELAEKLEKERKDKELADKLLKEKEEKEQKEKELADKQQKEKEEKEKQELAAKQQKEKEQKEKELADKQQKEKEEKEKKERELKLKLEKEQKEKELKLKQEREFAEKEERDRLEREKISKSVEKETKSSSITDQFKLSIEKQLQNQLENKKKPSPVTEDNNNNNDGSTSTLSSLTKDRVKMKSRQAPSKSHKAPGSISTSDNNNNNNNNEPSLLSKALESNNNNNNNESSPVTKKKIVLPPGAVGGIMGSMASLAMEAQRKKMEIDNNKNLANVLKEEPAAPNFVRGRSQSVSVTSTLKQDPNKFLNHKKSVDTYSGLRTRLIHCKGKKRILTKEVEISINSLNRMDTFVLDCGIENSNVGGESVDSNSHSTIFTWYGSKSTANKKAKAVAIAEIIKSHERGGHATIIKLDEGDENELFYKRISGKTTTTTTTTIATHKSTINPDGGDDLEAELNWASSFTLLKYLSDKDQLIHVETKSLSMELLESDGFYVLDTVSEFYEWSGRNADQSLKESFHKKCQERLKNNAHRQSWVESVVLSEGGETVLFREKFFDWPDLSHEVSLQRMGFGKKRVFDVSIPYEKKSPAKMNQFEVREMVEIERAEEVLKSDGSGEYEIWYIENCKSYPLPKEEYGHFFSGCCYLIRYTYTKWNALKYAIYYWQGADASRQDVGSSSLLSKDLCIETSARGECSQDPERQGRETNHFNMIFNGKMVVHRGDRGSYQFNGITRMYHVFGKRSNTITASQTTKLSSTCLNSRDCFIVTNGSEVTFIWESKGSNKQLKEESSKLASLSNSISKSKTNPTIKVIKEGSEPEEFWKLIGGNGKYANFDYVHQNVPTDWENQIKLFAVVNTGTIIRADEIYRFSQYDLTPSKVYLLDNRKNVFVWSGLRAQEKEKKRGMEIAIDYVKYLNDSRTENDVLFITQAEEPLSFTCYFHGWDTFRLNPTSNNATSNNVADGADEISADGASPKNAVNLLKKYYQVLPFEKLIEKNTPPEIDRSVLEMYLSDEDFEKHLGSRTEWDALPAWKKTEKKKISGLF
ncbi:hypothetical protein ACTA71_009997 [Dictyostelium dimigraforme]